jgi:hypothetical protein
LSHDKLKHIGHVRLCSFEPKGQKGTWSCTFKEPTRADAQTVMPRGKSRSVEREPGLSGHRPTKSFSASQYSGSLGAKTDCFTKFFKVSRVKFLAV